MNVCKISNGKTGFPQSIVVNKWRTKERKNQWKEQEKLAIHMIYSNNIFHLIWFYSNSKSMNHWAESKIVWFFELLYHPTKWSATIFKRIIMKIYKFFVSFFFFFFFNAFAFLTHASSSKKLSRYEVMWCEVTWHDVRTCVKHKAHFIICHFSSRAHTHAYKRSLSHLFYCY